MDCLKNKFSRTLAKYFYLQSKACMLFIFLFFYGNFESVAQCPSTGNITQSFCDIQSPTVANLQATDNGGGIAWYETAVSTTHIPFESGLENGKIYYLDNSAGNCGSRIAVTTSLYTAPTGQNFQGICVSNVNQATIASLYAAGNNIQWYSVRLNGTALPSNTQLISGTNYYAGQTNPITGCLTSRLKVFVSITVVNGPTGNAVQSFCNDLKNPPTVANLVASGINNWYSTNTSALVLTPNTPLINGQLYYATTVSDPCESEERLEVLVNLIPKNDAGKNAVLNICESNLLTGSPISLFNRLY